MKIFRTLLAVSVIALSVTACTTTPTSDKLVSTAKIAASAGTLAALDEHPEWRQGFERAATDLEALAAKDTLDTGDLLAILHRLPVKELKSNRAAIYITSAGLLIEEFGGVRVELDKAEGLRRLAKALADGIRNGLF